MAKNDFKIEGIDEVMESLKEIEKVPQIAVNRAARRGMRVIYYDVRKNAPVGETGNLKKAIHFLKERKVKPGKAVFQVTYNPEMSNLLAKLSPGRKDGRAYYPASQEYGFITRDGGYVKGRYFMKKSADSKYDEAMKTMEREMLKEIDVAIEQAEKRKARRKAGGK